MSNLHLAVEKVTESLVETFKVKMSFGLAANNKRREGVASSVGPLLTYLPMSNRNKTSACFYSLQGSVFENYMAFVRVMHSILDLALK